MTSLRAAAQQALEALEATTKHFGFARLGSSSLADTMTRGDAHVAMNNLRTALAAPPTNQCAETCERAKLCAVCARELSHE